MKSINFILILVVFLNLTLIAQTRQVCVSIDDLPVVNYGAKDTLLERAIMNNIIASLTANKIPAIGFVNEKKLFEQDALNDFQLSTLKNWCDAGLELGNHTYSHIDYNTSAFEDYSADILRGEIVSNDLLKDKKNRKKYFRHPFLHSANTKGKADSLNIFLNEHGYTAAPVTIDNEDYLFAKAYQRARIKNDSKLAAQIGTDYISYMEMKVRYFENESNALFNRNIKQILLIHASLLNSDYMDSLITMFKNNGYEFISIGQALEDEAYKSEITAFGNWGISWIDRWALSKGKKNNFFKDEPVTPAYINELAK